MCQTFQIVNMKTVVIIDKAEVPSKGVVFSLINHYPQTKIINFEKNTSYWHHESLSPQIDFLSIHELENLNRDSITKYLQEFISKLQTVCCVVIDSVNQLELLTSTNKCLEFIRDLENNKSVERIICTIHEDSLITDSILLRQIIHISDTRIKVNSLSNLGKYNLFTKKKSSSGKVTNVEEELYYDTEKKIWQYIEIKEKDQLRKVQTKVLPHDIASFKISVDESAKLVKNEMILPYTEVNKVTKIEYDDDNAIEWDDEDPDEDLDV